MANKHRGSCLCGKVRYEVTGDFERFYLCHCGRCRKGTGSAHGANLFSLTATLTWLSGKETVTGYQLPQTRHARSFCSVCGAALPMEQMAGRLLVVPAGSLDSPISTKPTAHIQIGSKASWDEGLETYPRMEGLPRN